MEPGVRRAQRQEARGLAGAPAPTSQPGAGRLRRGNEWSPLKAASAHFPLLQPSPGAILPINQSTGISGLSIGPRCLRLPMTSITNRSDS